MKQPSVPQPFEPLGFPLSGTRLIEASAGTGKTYNIANLYLRLILGMGGSKTYNVEQILVVTFTRAAAGELRGRIRSLLERAYRDFRAGASRHSFVQQLIEDTGKEGIEDATRLLHHALLDMDQASISTIHAFALKAASTFLFETGAIDGTEVSVSGDARRQQRFDDLFRSLAMTHDEAGQALFDRVCGKSIEDFRYFYGKGLPHVFEVRPELPVGSWAELEAKNRQLLTEHEAMQQRWEALKGSLATTDATGLREAIKQRFEQESQGHKLPSPQHLVGYLDMCFSASVPAYGDKRGTGYFKSLTDIPASEGSGECFDVVLAMRDLILESFALFEQVGPSLLLLEAVKRQALTELDHLSLDDVIRLINQRLEDRESAEAVALKDIIRATYPVCLVDEFQDTDPEQFHMFNEIYRDAGAGGFFMIGDPKQSIYAFRGADIFAYLNVRAKLTQSTYTLGTNWRSKQELVGAVNELFRESGEPEAAGTFVFDGIEYLPVGSCEALEDVPEKPGFALGEGSPLSVEPLVFIGNEADDKDTKPVLLRKFARDAACRISALLAKDSGARIGGEALKPGDIAVLVRDKNEARAMRQELARADIGLRSVYMSQKDSVVSESEISEDLYFVLRLLIEPGDKRRMKSALATPLMRGFSVDFDEMKRIDEDDRAYEQLIGEFSAYRDTWRDKGVLTALNELLANPERGLLPKIARRSDSDRILTDLRHLGDLLQQQDLQCDSQEQLIEWYAARLDDDSVMDEDAKRIRLESDERLVKIVTIHTAKGLEYPAVFLPFFFMPKNATRNSLPMYRERGAQGEYRAVIDFGPEKGRIEAAMQAEMLAEDMRLLYVAVTRAVYQCYVGISNYQSFGKSVWPHLLGDLGEQTWVDIRAALERRLEAVKGSVDFSTAGVVPAIRCEDDAESSAEPVRPTLIRPEWPDWRVLSYSRLAKGDSLRIGEKDDDEGSAGESARDETELLEQDRAWAEDVRYTTRGSAQTGNCLHDILEQRLLYPGEDFRALVERHMALYRLTAPQRPAGMSDERFGKLCERYSADMHDWLSQVLCQPVFGDAGLCLGDLPLARAVPEMKFDFRVGGDGGAADFERVNEALAEAGVSRVTEHLKTSGLMNGAIDLVFEHEGRFYVADYKSNTLGRAPRFYTPEAIGAYMPKAHYDLQYMIYTVAAHRYFSQRLGTRYHYEEGEYRFGGVLYFFLRGMGLQDEEGGQFADHGIWFTRPDWRHIDALDRAFKGVGEAGIHGGAS